MFLNQLEFQRYIQASAKRANLQVVWMNGVPPHANDKGQIVLPILPSDATELDYRRQLHIATHEASHVLYTDFTPFKTVNAGRSFLGHIFNGIEDVRIEWLNGEEYAGDKANSDVVYPHLCAPMIEHFTGMPASEKLEKKAILDKILSVVWFMVQAQSESYANAATVLPNIEKLLSPEAEAFVQKIKAGDYFEELRTVRSIADQVTGTNASLELAKRMFKEVYGEDPDKEIERLQQQQQPQQGKGKGQPQKGKGEGQPKKEKGEGEKDKSDGAGKGAGEKKDQPEKGEADKPGDGDSSGDTDDADSPGDAEDGGTYTYDEGESQEDKSEKNSDTLANVKYQEFLPNSHEMAPIQERPSSPSKGMHIDYTGYRGLLVYQPATKNQFVVGDFCRNKFDDSDITRVSEFGKRRLDVCLAPILAQSAGPAFAARVRTRLQIRSKDRFEHGVKRGKLQTALLHRVTMKDAHELSQKVFKRRIVNDTLDTAVIWLGDASGSMGGEKFAHLTAASVQFNEAVGNVIGLPIEIHTFSDVTSGGEVVPLMYVHRDFATRKLAQDELIRRMTVAASHMHANPDGDAILWSYDRLRASRAKRKLLIVASDGQPATRRPGNVDAFTCEVVKEIEEETPIEIVGIGIMDRNVSRIYKEHYIINDAAELETALLTLIDKKVR